jgi:predicted adenylyl cyclase CyaB
VSLQTTAALKPSRKLKLLKGEQGEVFVCPPVYFPMARNIEIKARIESVKALLPRIKAVAESGPTQIVQDDTFFNCAAGRLKLRAFSETAGELIFYQRPDSAGPKESSYLIAPTASPDRLRELLSLAYGQSGRVRKHRTLFLVGRTRIHLDRVEGLGDFIELEVVLFEGEPAEDGINVAQALVAKLGISPQQLIDGAYVDLLRGSRSTNKLYGSRSAPMKASGRSGCAAAQPYRGRRKRGQLRKAPEKNSG